MDFHGDIGMIGDHADQNLLRRMRDDGDDSRSGSENVEGGVASGDEHDEAEGRRPRKRYHRHTPLQIQELENFFKDCPHPDEKQRTDLSRRLGLENKQIKFWFQNRRTQVKNQVERHENVVLRQENEKLRAENELLKHSYADPLCNNCGGPIMPAPISFDHQQLRIENARLKEELSRITSMAKLGWPHLSSNSPAASFASSSKSSFPIGRHGFNSGINAGSPFPVGLDFNDGIIITGLKQMPGSGRTEVPYQRSVLVDLAMTAMDQLLKMAQIESPLWNKSSEDGLEVLNYDEYMRLFSPCIGVKPCGFVSEATKETAIVIVGAASLAETMMDVNHWREMFTGIVATASIIEIVANGMGGTKNGAMQVMHAEFQMVSPLVPVRQTNFLRYCKQHAEGVWAVVDISVGTSQESSNSDGFVSVRRLPSGYVIREMPNGWSKITWVEHSEYNENAVHPLYRSVLSSGQAFGARRWLATLQRQCECMAILMASSCQAQDPSVISPNGTKSILKLGHRMVECFCAGVCASSTHKWAKIVLGNNVGENVRILTRKILNEPGEPRGNLLSVATSVWLPVTQQRLFDFLKDVQSRNEWDFLANNKALHEMIHIPKSQGHGNGVFVMRSSAGDHNDNQGNTLLLQETWNDASGSLVVFAPVDLPSMSVVMNGGDSTYVSILPSGFVIIPDDSPVGNSSSSNFIKRGNGDGYEGAGCLLTTCFQVLVNNNPASHLTVESAETVNNLINSTIQRIKTALDLN